jgi:hypothetical protein
MVTLGFFSVGGHRWAPHTEMPHITPDAKFFRVPNNSQEACRACMRIEMRCAALEEPWRAQCDRFAAGIVAAQTTGCEVLSYVSAADAPAGTPIIPALAACSSACTSPTEQTPPAFERGYARPYLVVT